MYVHMYMCMRNCLKLYCERASQSGIHAVLDIAIRGLISLKHRGVVNTSYHFLFIGCASYPFHNSSFWWHFCCDHLLVAILSLAEQLHVTFGSAACYTQPWPNRLQATVTLILLFPLCDSLNLSGQTILEQGLAKV